MNKSKHRQMKEGWVEFHRWKCKKGYIDRWMGDCINDPNNKSKQPLQLNSFASYYRLNKGKWINSHDVKQTIIGDLQAYSEEFTAQEIWESNIKVHE